MRFPRSLSGRVMLLSAFFVMLAEVFIFVPSVARFRQDYLRESLRRAEVAVIVLGATGATLREGPAAEELREALGVFNVAVRRADRRELFLAGPVPGAVVETIDLDRAGPVELIRSALRELVRPVDGVLRVVGRPREGRAVIEVTLPAAPLRAAMLDYGRRILLLSLVISVITAALVYVALRRLFVAPVRRLVESMTAYAAAPEEPARIIRPASHVREIREAEEALRALELQLTRLLRQKEHLAALGRAVAKVSHDLRNMLTTATLVADRLETSADPAVRRVLPRLVRALARAVSLCERTLAFGRAEEPVPELMRVPVAHLVEELAEAEEPALAAGGVTLVHDIPPGMVARVDREQMLRVLGNLVRNAREAIEQAGRAGEIRIEGEETPDAWIIRVADNGPGLPEAARAHLFEPFQGSARKGGAGLGLAIASELVRGHGGELRLVRSGPEGTVFEIRLPKGGALGIEA